MLNSTDEDNPSIVDSNSRLMSWTTNQTVAEKATTSSGRMVPLNDSSFSNYTKHSSETLDLNTTMNQGIKVILNIADGLKIMPETKYLNCCHALLNMMIKF